MKPLAERLRPQTIDDFFGQEHLVGKEGVLRKMLTTGRIPSMIFWGPPGVGKTTLAEIISKGLNFSFYSLSAVSATVKDVKEITERAKGQFETIVFIDEIHRFNKAQQDALLNAVERGIFTLVGATTENPSFEVNNALLSRCQVFVFEPLSIDDLNMVLKRALEKDGLLRERDIRVEETGFLFELAEGDARKLLNILEMLIIQQGENTIIVNDETVRMAGSLKASKYDRKGDYHYDVISAFIKSIRGSDPNAAVYWLARMLEGGEDIRFIARRMVILAAEDIGNANPNALLLATGCFQAIEQVGMPEARIILSQAAIYLATSPKSNSAYLAIESAAAELKRSGDLGVPMAIRNAPTKLMKQLKYGEGYKYSHDYDDNFVAQDFLPEEISGKTFYQPGKNPKELEIKSRLSKWWKGKYGY